VASTIPESWCVRVWGGGDRDSVKKAARDTNLIHTLYSKWMAHQSLARLLALCSLLSARRRTGEVVQEVLVGRGDEVDAGLGDEERGEGQESQELDAHPAASERWVLVFWEGGSTGGFSVVS
jgi:hypothetical protein